MTILDVIGDNESFAIMAGALNNSSLNTVLTGNEMHTVFLPTDQAFENMSEGGFEELIANPDALEQVLLYHVANGTLMTGDLANVSNVTTLQGSPLPVNVTDEGIFVGDAEVIQANITADNGVIHVIDTVLIPPEGPAGENDIIETATQEGNFTTLLLAIGAANLTEDLKGEGPYTIFAPTDEAFNALPNGTIEALLNDTDTLAEILHYHMADGRLMAEDVVNMTNITTHTGDELPVNITEEGVFVGNARIVMQDINASNGVIHAIDTVLLPEEALGGPVELYNNTVNLTSGNFTFIPENDTQTYTIDNLTDFGALNATGLDFNVSVMQNLTGNMTGNMSDNMTGNATGNMSNVSFVLEGIENVTNNNATGEMWFVYINGTPAEEDFGMNNVSNGDNLSFWYTTEEGGVAAIENATYVANITVATEEGMEPQPGQNLTVLYNDTVNLTEGTFTFTPENRTQTYTADNFTDIGALNATGLEYNVSLQGVNFTNMTNTSVLEGIEGIRNNNTTGERWFVYINETQAEEDFGMNPVSNGTNLNFWYTTEEDGEASIENATYLANVTVAIEEGMGPAEENDIIETATEDGNFTTLLAAIEAANLTDTLKGEGPFTVFAPTDEAFDALPNGTINALVNDTDALTNILLYHVAEERLMAEDVVNLTNITTLQGSELPVNVTDEGVFVGDAEIIVQDINASNGVIHVIDSVLIPEEGMEPEPGQNLTSLYNRSVNLTQGNFTLRPENSTQSYRIDNFTDVGALNATVLDFNVSLMQNMTGNMTGVPFILQSIEGIRNNNTTGEMWFVYINGEPAEEDFGMNNVSTGDNLSFWYTTEGDGEAAIENATYVANVTVAELRARANVIPAAQNQTNLTAFVNAVQIANLTQTLNGTGPYTVCIPSNEAFNKLPVETRNQLMSNTTLLSQVLSYHVVSGRYTYEQLIRTNNVTNIQGNVLQINTIGNNITIQNVNVTQIIVVNNGVICIIDEVLVPPDIEIPADNQTDGNQTDGDQTNGDQTNGNQTADNLTGDWYFFSIPFEANNTSVEYLLSDLNYTSLIYYNASTKLFEDVSDIEPLKAYWINVPNGTEFNASEQFSSVEKKQITAPPSLQVYPGWNALGSPVNETVPAEAAFITLNNSSLNSSYAKIVGPWVPGNNTTGYYQYVGYNGLNGTIGENQLGADEFEVEPYEGYWVFIRQEYLYG